MRTHDLPVMRIALVAAGIAATVGFVVAGVLGWLQARDMSPGGETLRAGPPTAVEGPRLQSAPQLERQSYDDAKARQLNSTGWVDAGQHIAHIPIDDAMQLLVQRAASGPEGQHR